MARDDVDGSQPEGPRRLFRPPVYRDPLFLWTVGVALFTGLIIGFGNSPNRNAPPLIDGLLAASFFGFTLGVLPAYVRLLISRRRDRAQRLEQGSDTAEEFAERPLTVLDEEISSFFQKAVTVDPGKREDVRSPVRVDGRQVGDAPASVTPPPAPPRPVSTSTGPPQAAPKIKPDLRDGEYRSALRDAKQNAPYPIAYAARAVDGTATDREEHQAILDAAEVVAVSVCSYLLAVAVSSNVRFGSNHPATRLLRNGIPGLGASFDSWLSAARGLADRLPAAASGRHRIGETFLTSLDTIKEERNRSAHGSRPRTEEDARLRLSGGLREAFTAALKEVSYLDQTDWVVVESIALGRDGRWTAAALSAMGDHPDFTRLRISPDGPMIDGEVYARDPDGHWATLGPVIAHRYCADCSRHQMFYADQVTKDRRVRYRQFMHPHATHDDDLVTEMQRFTDTLWTQGATPT